MFWKKKKKTIHEIFVNIGKLKEHEKEKNGYQNITEK